MRLFGLLSLLFFTSGCSLFTINGDEFEGDSSTVGGKEGFSLFGDTERYCYDIGGSEYTGSDGFLASFAYSTYPSVGGGIGFHASYDEGVAKDVFLDNDYVGFGLGVSYSVNEAVGVYVGGATGTITTPSNEEISESGVVLGAHAFVTDFQPFGSEAVVFGIRVNTAIDSTILNVGLAFE